MASRALNVDVVSEPALSWLLDCVLTCDYLPVGCSAIDPLASGSGRDSPASSGAPAHAMLDPLERIWHVARRGPQLPVYENLLTQTRSEEHPLASFVSAGVAWHKSEPALAATRGRGSEASS